MKQVTTPIGVMNVAGPMRSNGGILFDLFFAVMCVVVILGIFEFNENVRVIFGAIIIAVYIILAYQGVLPSLGRWALGLHRFKFSEIEEFHGKGTLVVYEELDAKVCSARTIISVVIFIFIYIVANYVTQSG